LQGVGGGGWGGGGGGGGWGGGGGGIGGGGAKNWGFNAQLSEQFKGVTDIKTKGVSKFVQRGFFIVKRTGQKGMNLTLYNSRLEGDSQQTAMAPNVLVQRPEAGALRARAEKACLGTRAQNRTRIKRRRRALISSRLSLGNLRYMKNKENYGTCRRNGFFPLRGRELSPGGKRAGAHENKLKSFQKNSRCASATGSRPLSREEHSQRKQKKGKTASTFRANSSSTERTGLNNEKNANNQSGCSERKKCGGTMSGRKAYAMRLGRN